MTDSFEKYLYDKVFPQQPPQTIFHYTTQRGILGIISNQEMWATQIQFLNDKNEVFLTFQLLKKELDKKIGTIQIPEVRNILRKIRSYLELIDQGHICIASFCAIGDLLSQWRGYGNHGKGYAIGFDLNKLRMIAKNQKFVLWPCVYDATIQNELIDYLINGWCQKYTDARVPDKDLFELVDKDVCQLAPILKDESFSEEKEWRLVSSTVSSKSDRFAFREGQFALIPYYNFPIVDEENKYAIDSIVVGPSPHMELAMNSLETFLRTKDISKVKIRSSRIPFRNWK